MKIKMFFNLSEGMENCKKSGKSQGILKWMISENPDAYILYMQFVYSNLVLHFFCFTTLKHTLSLTLQ